MVYGIAIAGGLERLPAASQLMGGSMGMPGSSPPWVGNLGLPGSSLNVAGRDNLRLAVPVSEHASEAL